MRSYFKHGQVQPCIFPARGISGISRVGVKWHAQGYVDVCVCVCVCLCLHHPEDNIRNELELGTMSDSAMWVMENAL